MSRNGSRTLRAASIGACHGFKIMERELMRVRRLSPATRQRLEQNEVRGEKANRRRRERTLQ